LTAKPQKPSPPTPGQAPPNLISNQFFLWEEI
jgi:hypothetical protein